MATEPTTKPVASRLMNRDGSFTPVKANVEQVAARTQEDRDKDTQRQLDEAVAKRNKKPPAAAEPK